MTVDEVLRRIEEIDEIADLTERAHMEEDRLYRDVLEAIARGVANPEKLARAALSSRRLNLDRHYSSRIG
ncbi:MAG TPA: hypothetical protein VIL42_03470 [Sphingomicrobium sp.]|jgi:folate-dependent phosphoribosylglycinamide formyltransferase PurN